MRLVPNPPGMAPGALRAVRSVTLLKCQSNVKVKDEQKVDYAPGTIIDPAATFHPGKEFAVWRGPNGAFCLNFEKTLF